MVYIYRYRYAYIVICNYTYMCIWLTRHNAECLV